MFLKENDFEKHLKSKARLKNTVEKGLYKICKKQYEPPNKEAHHQSQQCTLWSL